MILVDTSVWINHLRHDDAGLRTLLFDGQVATHECVIAELGLGSIARRREVLEALGGLPRLPRVDHDFFMEFVERRQLFARGVGAVDAHLLASLLITPGSRLWTRDRRLANVAEELGVC